MVTKLWGMSPSSSSKEWAFEDDTDPLCEQAIMRN